MIAQKKQNIAYKIKIQGVIIMGNAQKVSIFTIARTV